MVYFLRECAALVALGGFIASLTLWADILARLG